MLYDVLLERGYKYSELYDMTLKEIRNTIKCVNKGLAYQMYKQSILTSLAVWGKLPDIEKACAELYPPKKTYIMPEWLKERYKKQIEKGGK